MIGGICILGLLEGVYLDVQGEIIMVESNLVQ